MNLIQNIKSKIKGLWQYIFHSNRKEESGEAMPLCIEDMPAAPLTPEPDDAEAAAEALLASLAAQSKGRNVVITKSRNNEKVAPAKGSTAYYRFLSSRIRDARGQERREAMRLVAYCEAQLNNGQWLMVNGQSIEQGLFKHQDTVEREGGELLKRWQHCLAEVTVRLMEEVKNQRNQNIQSNQKQ